MGWQTHYQVRPASGWIENTRIQMIHGHALIPIRVKSIESVTARNVHQIHEIFIDEGREERVFR